MTDHTVTRAIVSEYTDKYPESNTLHQGCMKYISAGTTRSLSYFKPYPLHIASGKGAYVYTHEGHELLDVTNNEAVLETPDELQAWLHLSLLNKEVYPAPRGLFILSTPMGTKEMVFFTSAMDEALAELKPYIQDKYPHLLL